MSPRKVHNVIPVLQQYAWGKPDGQDSAVEKLYKCNPTLSSVTFAADAKFAELWMGCHPNGMATVIDDDGVKKPIDQYVKDQKFDEIRYMFKVLSVDKPLSLQLHPSKPVAEQLHRDFPEVYKDSNHKPEIAIALTEEFHALAGFRPHKFLLGIIEQFPLLKTVFFGSSTTDIPSDYSTFISTILNGLVQPQEDAATIQKMIDDMLLLADKQYSDPMINEMMDVFKTLTAEYNGDKSVFSACIMNKYTLKRGECIFLEAGLLHAYLKGDCVECMASSDNVIRGGLTPKYIDVPNLMKYTRFEEGGPQMVTPVPLTEEVVEYNPPVDDFVVKKISLPDKESFQLSCSQLACHGLSMCIVSSGTGTIVCPDNEVIDLTSGLVFCLDPDFEVTVKDAKNLELWIATQ